MGEARFLGRNQLCCSRWKFLEGTDMYGVLHPDEGPEQENGEIHCDDGWGHLMVVVEGQPKEVWTLLPYGQSEDLPAPL
jgi:hypothetical protein